MKFLRLIIIFTLIINSYSSFSQEKTTALSDLALDSTSNCYLRYYYYPNIQAYFDLLHHVYYYNQNGQWQTNKTLPPNYGGYSLFRLSRVPITDFEENEPYLLLPQHKKQFPFNPKGIKK